MKLPISYYMDSASPTPSAISLPAGLAIPYRLMAGVTIALSAFLLFQVQPIIARQILPWFGGTAAVWTTCLLFFQAVLFLGYVYAHCLCKWASPQQQATLHTALLAGSLLLLPVSPSVEWRQAGGEPITRILGLLTVTAGMPFGLLSATSPLVQSWLSRSPGHSLPYRFYALSNAASLAALLLYPLAIEPWMATQAQSNWWSVLYGVFALCCAACAWYAPQVAAAFERAERPATAARLGWLALSAIPSALSLAVTNHLCQNVAPIPFLWVVPLGVYLLTLMFCFDEGWYRRRVFLPAYLGASAVGAWLLMHESPNSALRLMIPFFSGLLFLACMYFHGELALRKPPARQLTSFYLMTALGGALGALVVAIGAPLMLSGNHELTLVLAMAATAALMIEYRKHWALDIACTAVAVAMCVAALAVIGATRSTARISERNFYGALRVVEGDGQRALVHGVVSHGFQVLDPAKRLHLTAYYAPGSGIERTIELTRKPGMRVGVVGLGVGNLAALAEPGDTYRFYEINPRVEALARSEFPFLSECRGRVEVAIGDGRLTLEHEKPRVFDVLAIDAFSGDSIPFHMLSLEAVREYRRHLAPGGILAFHVSNSVLRLAPVAQRLAEASGLEPLHIHASSDAAQYRSESDWVMMAPGGTWSRYPELVRLGSRAAAPASVAVWTDDYSNLFQVFK